MPDMPQPASGGAPAPGQAPGGPQGVPPQGGDAGGPQGLAAGLAQIDTMLSQLNDAMQDPGAPQGARDAVAEALSAFRHASQLLAGSDGGGAEPDEDDAGGATTQEQGGSKTAVPMTHQNMRG